MTIPQAWCLDIEVRAQHAAPLLCHFVSLLLIFAFGLFN
jgi:hypothetical protein